MQAAACLPGAGAATSGRGRGAVGCSRLTSGPARQQCYSPKLASEVEQSRGLGGAALQRKMRGGSAWVAGGARCGPLTLLAASVERFSLQTYMFDCSSLLQRCLPLQLPFSRVPRRGAPPRSRQTARASLPTPRIHSPRSLHRKSPIVPAPQHGEALKRQQRSATIMASPQKLSDRLLSNVSSETASAILSWLRSHGKVRRRRRRRVPACIWPPLPPPGRGGLHLTRRCCFRRTCPCS